MNGQFKDPATKIVAKDVPIDRVCSWLGAFKTQGWSIRITPALTPQQWEQYGAGTEDGWDPAEGRFDENKCIAILCRLFPHHSLELSKCACGGAHPHSKTKFTVSEIQKMIKLEGK